MTLRARTENARHVGAEHEFGKPRGRKPAEAAPGGGAEGANHGGVRERRDQLTHRSTPKPELLAEEPNELRSWDVSKLKGPAKWTWFYPGT
jgi:hypothetical protein